MSSDKTATERLRELLDERGVEWKEHRHVMPGSMAIQRETLWGQPTDVASGKPIPHVYHYRATEMGDGRLFLEAQLVTPEQAIAATLGREQQIDPAWERWRDGLWHAEIKTIGDAVQQLMYETIEHGGDMGPNGNTYGGVDEGEVLTLGFINDWIDKFEATLGNDGPVERGTCHITERNGSWYCDACGNEVGDSDPTSELFIDGNAVELWEFCPRCGRKVVDE